MSLFGQRLLGNFKKLDGDDVEPAVYYHEAVAKPMPIPFQYGGDIAANFVLAAARRVNPKFQQRIMSLSIDYVNPGDYGKVRRYRTAMLRESPRFTHVDVELKQDYLDSDNLVVASGNVAFHGDEHHSEKSLSYQPKFPEDCPLPASLEEDSVWFSSLEKESNLEPSRVKYAQRQIAIRKGLGMLSRPVQPVVYFRFNQEPETRMAYWIRFNDIEAELVHSDLQDSGVWAEALLAYASDFRILGPALRQRPDFRDSKTTTLSHTIWFSPDCRLTKPTDWMLYDTKVVMSGNNTILCDGYMWNEQKQLLAVTRQQGLCRPE